MAFFPTCMVDVFVAEMLGKTSIFTVPPTDPMGCWGLLNG